MLELKIKVIHFIITFIFIFLGTLTYKIYKQKKQ